MDAIVVATRSVIVALAGVGIAWGWFTGRQPWVVLGAVAAIAIAGGLDQAGREALPKHPERAVRLLEWWLLYPMVLAAIGAGVVIVVAVALTVPKDAPPQTEELLSALSTGITAFIAAVVISWTEDKDDSRLADHIQEAFEAKYLRPVADQPPKPGVHYFKPDSRGERWVYSPEYGEIEGWGRRARLKRAKGIAAELASGNSDP
jgi:hypothetical protein